MKNFINFINQITNPDEDQAQYIMGIMTIIMIPLCIIALLINNTPFINKFMVLTIVYIIYATTYISRVIIINHKINKSKKIYKIKCILKDGYVDKMYCPSHWLDKYKKLYKNSYGDDIKNLIIKPTKIWMCPHPFKEIFDYHWDNVDQIFGNMLNHLTKEN